MDYKTFKEELLKQVGLNAEYFKPAEVLTLHDFAETIAEKDFNNKQ